MGVARRVVLNPEQKEVLEQCARARSRSGRQVEGARIVWLAAAGKLDQERAAALNVTAHKAARWRNRFLDLGMAGLEKDAPRAGRTPRIPAATVQQVVDKTTLEKPANATHWSTRTRAAAVNLSAATVRRIWHEQGAQTASDGNLPSILGPAFCRDVGGDRRSVSPSARTRTGVVL